MKTRTSQPNLLKVTLLVLLFPLMSFSQKIINPGETDMFADAGKSFQLVSFTVKFIEGVSYAGWVVIEPANDCLYLLERSKDNKEYKVVFSKPGTKSPGNGIELYHCYKDESPYKGISYYRIRRISANGCVSSEVIKIAADNAELGLNYAQKLQTY
jgi:hypothetical protein